MSQRATCNSHLGTGLPSWNETKQASCSGFGRISYIPVSGNCSQMETHRADTWCDTNGTSGCAYSAFPADSANSKSITQKVFSELKHFPFT